MVGPTSSSPLILGKKVAEGRKADRASKPLSLPSPLSTPSPAGLVKLANQCYISPNKNCIKKEQTTKE